MTRDELHSLLLSICLEIDKVCRKNNIEYYLEGGSLLGMVRDKGFIPWDDDLDICIWYREKERLVKALREELPPNLSVIEIEDMNPYFYDFVMRVVDKRYNWHEPTKFDECYENKNNYVGIDIMFISPTANTKLGQKLEAFKIKTLYGMAMGHRPSLDYSKYKGLQLAQVKLLSGLGKLYSTKSICKKFQNYNRRRIDKKKKYCIFTSETLKHVGKLYETEWFKEPQYMAFEDAKLPAPKGYDGKLRVQFGDYMTPVRDSIYITHMQFDENGNQIG